MDIRVCRSETLTITTKMKEQLTRYCPWFLHSPAIDINNEIFYEFMGAPIDGDVPYSNCPDSWVYALTEFHLVGVNISDGGF